MAEHNTGPAETGAPMDYKEHEKTYNLFLSSARVGSAIIAALLIAMAAGFVQSSRLPDMGVSFLKRELSCPGIVDASAATL